MSAAAVFGVMGEAITRGGLGPDLVKQVKGVIRFDLGNGAVYTIDLKNGSGSVSQSADGKADITIKISEENFIALTEEKLNPQQAFMQGKLKIKGNMGLAMKLQKVIGATKAKAAELGITPESVLNSAAATGESSLVAEPATLQSGPLFEQMGEAVRTQGEQLVKQVKGVIRFKLTNPSAAYTLNLKTGSGSLSEGEEGKADITITVSDDNFTKLASGQLNPQQAFMKGVK
jgi:3-hydroxyacyl-CoA dehydrogenase/3a,7a,12a-trihydroxy-5b-cholest-24-enoyl-CoA hydratase